MVTPLREFDGYRGTWGSDDDFATQQACCTVPFTVTQYKHKYHPHPRQRQNSRSRSDSWNSEVEPSVKSEDPTQHLVDAMKTISFKEREVVLEEMHGVASEEIIETPEVLDKAIASLKETLNSNEIPSSDRVAFDRALFLKPTLLEDRKFLLIFLRCHLFDISKAAKAICLHYEHKMLLFEDENLLVRRITLDDLNEDDKRVVFGGSLLILPEKDQSGRTVRIANTDRYNFQNWKAELRGMWYQNMALLEVDEEFQRKGSVDIYNVYWERPAVEMKTVLDFLVNAGQIMQNWPFRTVAFHYCMNRSFLDSIFSFLYRIMPTEQRLRTKHHFGTPMEVSYTLRTFGIDVKDFLTLNEKSAAYTKALAKHHQYLKELEAEALDRETLTKKHGDKEWGIKLYPSKEDILIGRGKLYREHYGNQCFAQYWIPLYSYRYRGLDDNFSKTALIIEILQRIKLEQKGRFLTRTDEGWKIVDDSVAREKISQAIRAGNRKNRDCTTSTPTLNSFFGDTANILPDAKRRRLGVFPS